jgi:hypothetical protein
MNVHPSSPVTSKSLCAILPAVFQPVIACRFRTDENKNDDDVMYCIGQSSLQLSANIECDLTRPCFNGLHIFLILNCIFVRGGNVFSVKSRLLDL